MAGEQSEKGKTGRVPGYLAEQRLQQALVAAQLRTIRTFVNHTAEKDNPWEASGAMSSQTGTLEKE